MKLTEEQKKIVEDNHNLVYWYANMKSLDIEEWYDLLSIELCISASKYDSERGSFANYFKLRADGLVYKEIQKKIKAGSSVTYIDAVASNDIDLLEDELSVSEWLDKHEFSDILKLKLQGYTQKEIADIIGLSQSYVSQVLRKAKGEYYETNR